MLGFENMTIRFFVYDTNDDGNLDIVETDESTFLSADGEITYERHTVRENGVNQICLTKSGGY